jgi:hypothetical protein
VASIIEQPGPRVKIPPRCAMCHGVIIPSFAEYWHSGARKMRFWKVVPRIVRGLNSVGGRVLSLWGEKAVPAGGDCAGVK